MQESYREWGIAMNIKLLASPSIFDSSWLGSIWKWQFWQKDILYAIVENSQCGKINKISQKKTHIDGRFLWSKQNTKLYSAVKWTFDMKISILAAGFITLGNPVF